MANSKSEYFDFMAANISQIQNELLERRLRRNERMQQTQIVQNQGGTTSGRATVPQQFGPKRSNDINLPTGGIQQQMSMMPQQRVRILSIFSKCY